ncbi:unnamed protein product [Merluccius merluccius]
MRPAACGEGQVAPKRLINVTLTSDSPPPVSLTGAAMATPQPDTRSITRAGRTPRVSPVREEDGRCCCCPSLSVHIHPATPALSIRFLG